MTDSNPFASLSSTLLARKGHAKPAMRPQGFHIHREPTPDALEDLGWNDMGDEPSSHRVVALTSISTGEPVAPLSAPVPVQQQQDLAREFETSLEAVAAAQPYAAPVVRAAPGMKAKAAFTLRLDGDRHLRLRLVCAVNHRSAQQIVTQALDEFLARQPTNMDLTRGSMSMHARASTGDRS
ncbi:MAG: hypothetical protein ACKVOJ_10750 [Sphingomonadaceae bacterium]